MKHLRTVFYILLCFVLAGKLSGQYMQNGGFEKVPYEMPETAPGMMLIEGTTHWTETSDRQSVKYTLPPFYIGIYEETNGQYIAYLTWIKNCYSKATYIKALPDTTVWLKEHLPDTLKDRLMRMYLRSFCFRDYPVVGVSPEQVKQYAKWKTDRLNEMILIREGLLDFVYYPTDSLDTFSTEAYIAGKWTGQLNQKLPSFDETTPERDVRMEDGIFLPEYRMPTKEEYFQATNGAIYQTTIKTPKAISNRKFDKLNYFGHLFVKPIKNRYPLKIQLRPVYDAGISDYSINGLFDNVSEWVMDSGKCCVALGNSWKDDDRSYSFPPYSKFSSYYRIYNYYAYMDSVKKTFPNDFVIPTEKRSKVSAIVGFRLAMDYIGPITPPCNRRRTK